MPKKLAAVGKYLGHVRNAADHGVDTEVGAPLCGWETREMFKRYAIKDEPALAAAVAKLAAAAPDRQVLPMKRKAAAK